MTSSIVDPVTLAKLPRDHQEAIRIMMEQMTLVLVERLGGEVIIPVHEINSTPIGKILLVQPFDDKRGRGFILRVKRVQ